MAVAVRMGKDLGAAVHPFFLPKNIGSSTPYVDVGFDQNDGRRKRQRTASPEQLPKTPVESTKGTWIDHDPSAASGRPAAIDDGDSFTSLQREDVEQAQVSASVIGTMSRKRGRPASNVLPLIDGGGTAGKNSGQLSGTVPDQETAVTPPKKMLKVRPDGKLGSPKTKDFPQDTKPKRSRRVTRAGAAPMTLVVKVKYGVDDGSHVSMGRKIDEIRAGATNITGPLGGGQIKAIEPPKPTHPFFLAGPVLAHSQHSETPNDDQRRLRQDTSLISKQLYFVSPTKARVSSRPADVTDDPVGGIAFGCNNFGSDHARVSRFPGAVEPIWPPADMVHVGRLHTSLGRPGTSIQAYSTKTAVRKMKGVEIRVHVEEDVLKPYTDLVRIYQLDERISQSVNSRDWRKFRRPLRRLMTGRELQQVVLPRLASRSSLKSSEDQDMDELGNSQSFRSASPTVLQHLYDRLASSLTAFDKFECETQDWMHKYAPSGTKHVLQQSQDVTLLRDWLSSLTITSVECRDRGNSRTRDSSVASRRRGINQKKRKRAEELDGFVVSSDEEASLMDEVTDLEDFQPSNSLLKKSVIRSGVVTGSVKNNERSTNAVVIGGPHGCGKTAAIYAVAQELDFEIFEINAASRRSGKDILEKVGDMTRNHLVQRNPDDQEIVSKEETEEQQLMDAKLKRDLESGRQGTMNSFFKSTTGPKRKPPAKTLSPRKEMPKSNEKSKKQKSQKQSLILLEDVDVLFEDDKLFWTTVLDLLLQSKRPVIMTCSDESLLPLNDMALHAIFRLGPPPEHLATDYLLLVACNEGHLLPRHAVSELYKAKASDLRASIAELSFFCQMAIGDTKGGLDWMLIRSTAERLQDRDNEPLRVISEATYQHGMGWLSGEVESSQSDQSLGRQVQILSEAWYGWGIDIGASEGFLPVQASACLVATSPEQANEALQNFEQACEALSAGDLFPSSISRELDTILLDTTTPELTESLRHNYIEGSNVLEADPIIDHTGLSDSLVLTLRICARRLCFSNGSNIDPSLLTEQIIYDMIPQTVQNNLLHIRMSKSSISPAFDPIARHQNPALSTPKGPQISAFDSPISTIAQDLAPYARAIVAYDLRLEHQRHHLTSLLSHPLTDGKKPRTTRASRAALEGGTKAHTRRERWFPNNTNFAAVLLSGGHDWQDVLLSRRPDVEDTVDDAPRVSEHASALHGDA